MTLEELHGQEEQLLELPEHGARGCAPIVARNILANARGHVAR